MSHESAAVQAAEAEVFRQLKPGFNHISDTPDLETAYLHYEAEQLDAMYKGDPNVVQLHQLPKQQILQIGAVTMQLVSKGLVPADIARKRLQRMRVRTINESSAVNDRLDEGEFDKGLVTVKAYDDASLGDHAVLHEVTHGLAIPGWAVNNLGYLIHHNGGLESVLATNQEKVKKEYLPVLHNMKEAIIDTTALAAGSLNNNDYLSGKYGIGYASEDIRLGVLARRQPQLVAEAMRAVFTTGLQSNEQAHRLAEAYSSIS